MRKGTEPPRRQGRQGLYCDVHRRDAEGAEVLCCLRSSASHPCHTLSLPCHPERSEGSRSSHTLLTLVILNEVKNHCVAVLSAYAQFTPERGAKARIQSSSAVILRLRLRMTKGSGDSDASTNY